MPPDTPVLSESAVAVLRFENRGWRAKDPSGRLPAYRELAEAGIMEPVPGSDTAYRFTAYGLEHGEAIEREEGERIERNRYEPPDVSWLSEAAWELLRRIATGDRVEVDAANRPLFRELMAARVVMLGHTFTKGGESMYRFTYWGWKRREEWLGGPPSRAGSPAHRTG